MEKIEVVGWFLSPLYLGLFVDYNFPLYKTDKFVILASIGCLPVSVFAFSGTVMDFKCRFA